MTDIIQKASDLYFRDSSINSDKEYHLRIVETFGAQFMVQFSYGRRGSRLNTGDKGTYSTFMEAERMFNNIERVKISHGYQKIEATEERDSETLKRRANELRERARSRVRAPTPIFQGTPAEWPLPAAAKRDSKIELVKVTSTRKFNFSKNTD